MSHPIKYTVQAYNLGAHILEITLEIAKPHKDGQVVSLPAWIPGSYMIRDFAKEIVTISAKNASGSLNLSKIDKQTWQVAPSTEKITISYQVYCWDLSVRGAHVDQTHIYFNGTSVFLSVKDQEWDPVIVEIKQPMNCPKWRVATTLTEDKAKRYGFGTYSAQNYDELIDNPVEIGDFDVFEFKANGVQHEVILTGKHYCDGERVTHDLQKICETQMNFFGSDVKVDRYLFLVQVLANGFGGLEHKRCCSLHCSRDELPRRGMGKPHKAYIEFLSLCSHEYFHFWNVKRLRPKVFVPYQLEQEVHTTLLWVFEGFTRYYEDIMLVRSGVISESAYLQQLSELLTQLLRSPGRHKQSVTDSSFDAWTKLYKHTANSPNATISYYTKGAVVALAIDLSIRQQHNGSSLDDVLLELWRQFGIDESGITQKDVDLEIAKVMGPDFQKNLDEWLYTTNELELQELFSSMGLNYTVRYQASLQDRGGKLDPLPLARSSLGIRGQIEGAGLKVTYVLDGGCAQVANIAAGDIIVAIDGLKIQANWEAQIANYPMGQVVELHYFRDDLLMLTEIELDAFEKNTVQLTKISDAPLASLERRKQWLRLD